MTRWWRWSVAPAAVLLVCCGGARQGGQGTTAQGAGGDGGAAAAARYQAVAAEARELSQDVVAGLPEVAEADIYLTVEATLPARAHDAALGGWPLVPPEGWSVGTTADNQEVRVEFLEPDGGAMVVAGEPGELSLPDEVTVTWVVRYSRRNTLLTEAGSAVAVHVVPVAARLEAEGVDEPRYWAADGAVP